MNFEWTQEALNSLRIIEHYVSDIAGEKIGKSFTRKLFLKASTLIEFPQIGRAVPQFLILDSEKFLRVLIESSTG